MIFNSLPPPPPPPLIHIHERIFYIWTLFKFVHGQESMNDSEAQTHSLYAAYFCFPFSLVLISLFSFNYKSTRKFIQIMKLFLKNFSSCVTKRAAGEIFFHDHELFDSKLNRGLSWNFLLSLYNTRLCDARQGEMWCRS